MTVRKKGNRYVADFMMAGTRYREFFPTEKEAEEWEEEARLALKRGKPLPATRAPSLGGAGERTILKVFRSAKALHWDNLKSSDSTVWSAKRFLNWVGENTPPEEALSLDKIREYVEYLITDRHISNSSVNHAISMLCVLMKFANIKRPDDLPWMRRPKGRVRYFTEDEVNLVIQTLTLWGEDRVRDLFIFLVDTGARPHAEALPLRWTDFRDRYVTFSDTKNGTTRTLPLTKRAQEAVERQRHKGVEGPFWGVTHSRARLVWKRVRAHIPSLDDTVLYTARHTCASWQAIAGIDMRRIMMWMGHTDIKTTMIYAHLSPSHLLDNVAALENISSPKLTLVQNNG